jgi:integrase
MSKDRRIPVDGHPGIYLRHGKYEVRFRDRQNIERSRTRRTLTEAVRLKGQIDSGDKQITSRVPFKTYALEWVESYTGRTNRGLSEETRNQYRAALTRYAIPFFKNTPLERIDPPMMRRFIAELTKVKPNKSNERRKFQRKLNAPATVRANYAPVRAMLATAYEDGLLPSNPAQVRVVVKDTRPRKPKWLTVAQTRALLAAMPAADADLAYFLAATGSRISEALAARWQDVGPDDEGRIVLTVQTSKTAAGLREIPLSPETTRRLMKRRADAIYAGGEHPIFPSSTGTPNNPNNYRRDVFKAAAERAGVPWATPHKLRHGLASLMANRGYSAAQIAALLGHADGGVLAMRTYIHPEQLDSVEFVDEAFGEGS